MERLRRRRNQLPRLLYRVQYDGCNTGEVDGNLLAADTTTTFDETAISEFRTSVVHQFTRTNRLPTPFVSLFSEGEHAENWAPRMGENVTLWTIGTTSWVDPLPCIFKLSTLCTELSITLPDGASQHFEGAYLCLHMVPPRAIDSVVDRGDIQRSAENRRANRAYRDMFPYYCDNSDGEAAMDNWNDDSIKMIEGDWEW